MFKKSPKTIIQICKSFTHEIDEAVRANELIEKTKRKELEELKFQQTIKSKEIANVLDEVTAGKKAIVNIKSLFGVKS